MKRALLLLLSLAACPQYRTADLNFGETGEGLDGFLCKDKDGMSYMLDRLGTSPGFASVSIVADLVSLENGQPGCRTGQLIKWCAPTDGGHDCRPLQKRRVCVSGQLPTGIKDTKVRDDQRKAVLTAMRDSLTGKRMITDAPDEFVMVRIVGTMQPCEEIAPESGETPPFTDSQLLGCAYSCPVLLDRADDVYLGFDGLVGACEQGVRICASSTLNWMP